ncbi:hypothetical protein D5086_027021 [Populus alba]|uniref:Uncharacterized protein n=3 Tax=Populus alba TaxID=43335 RepID=A0ACC4B3I7_POPAL|nr:uncharacterized CRM domain-containing protein At3g25440, chloroplastic-like isoform X1 [Populus alba]
MAVKRFITLESLGLCKSHHLKNFHPNHFTISSNSYLYRTRFLVRDQCITLKGILFLWWVIYGFTLCPSLNNVDKVVEPTENIEKTAAVFSGSDVKVKRPKLKGKRAVVRWLKFFRWKKKKEYERMTAEEKILYKLRKAQRKEERFVQALKKIEPKESSEATHDPEILTPEEHFFFLKMGLKCKNYVPVGRRGIYQGVILNMHLHWKKHQTLKVVVKTFTPEEVKEIAAELARFTGGIVLDIHEEDTIIMYRGKNYSQPPTEIMSPRVTLSRKKALDKSKCRDGLRALRRYIPRLQQDLELLHARAGGKGGKGTEPTEETPETDIDGAESRSISSKQLENSEKLKEIIDRQDEGSEDSPDTDLGIASDSEDLSDIFETDSDADTEETSKRPLYLEEFEKFSVEADGEHEDFEEHLRQISLGSKKGVTSGKDVDIPTGVDVDSPSFDEVDRMFLRAASLLKRKKR